MAKLEWKASQAPNPSVPEIGQTSRALTACFLPPSSPTVTRTRRRTRCSSNRAERDAIAAAEAAIRTRCGNLSYNNLSSNQCDGQFWNPTGDQCALINDRPTVIYTRSDENECGIWPFRHRDWRAEAQRGGNCGWRCRSN